MQKLPPFNDRQRKRRNLESTDALEHKYMLSVILYQWVSDGSRTPSSLPVRRLFFCASSVSAWMMNGEQKITPTTETYYGKNGN